MKTPSIKELVVLAEKAIAKNHMWHDSPIQPDELILARGILAIAKQQEELVEALKEAVRCANVLAAGQGALQVEWIRLRTPLLETLAQHEQDNTYKVQEEG